MDSVIAHILAGHLHIYGQLLCIGELAEANGDRPQARLHFCRISATFLQHNGLDGLEGLGGLGGLGDVECLGGLEGLGGLD